MHYFFSLLFISVFSLSQAVAQQGCDWTKIYETTTPNRNASGAIVYTTGFGTTGGAASSYTGGISRVKYRFENDISGTSRWVEVSFDAWTGLVISDLQVPDYSNNLIINRNVSNLYVESNMPGVNTGYFSLGRLEMWPNDYSVAVSGLNPVGNNTNYDWDDTWNNNNAGSGHGSFQIHNVTSGFEQTIFAWNNHRNGSTPAIGIGNSPGGTNTDWTFVTTNGSTHFKVQIFVKSKKEPLSFGNALDFDRTNLSPNFGDYVYVGQPLASNSSYTIEAWVKQNNSTGSQNIVSTDNAPFWVDAGTLSAGVGGNYTLVTSPNFPTGIWTHVAVTFDDAANTMKLYKNGELVSTNANVTLSYTQATTHIGSHLSPSASSFFNGAIDEVRIWNVVRSQQEIQRNMNIEIAAQTGLRAYYNFNSGAPVSSNAGVTTLLDKSNNNFNGTLYNFALTGNTSNWVPGISKAISAITGTTAVCVGSTTTLSNADLGGSWSSANMSVATINASTGVVTALSAGTSTITYAITTADGCAVSTTTTVTVHPSANAGTDMLGIPSRAITLAANPPVTLSGAWSIVSGPNTNTSQFASTSTYNTTFTPTAKGVYVLRWTLSGSTCATASDDVSVRIVDDIWKGTTSSLWSTATNWESGTVPAGGAGVEIVVSPTATNDITLDANRTLSKLDFNGTSIKVNLLNFDLTAGSLVGTGSNTFIVTNGVGKLKSTIAQNGNFTFPIGIMVNSTTPATPVYLPVTITNNSVQNEYYVTVSTGVYSSGGTSGTPAFVGAPPRIEMTWNIGNNASPSAVASPGINILFNWPPAAVAATAASMNAPMVYHHNGTQWTQLSNTPTFNLASGSLSYTGYVGSFSPFAIAQQNSTLPVTWLYFTGEILGTSNLLKWSTAAEQNTKDFVIEYSIDGSNWFIVGNLTAAGNSSTSRNYTFTHSNLQKGEALHYYRILQRDLDGRFSYSKVISVKNRDHAEGTLVFPNPAKDVLVIKSTQEQEVRLTTMEGIIIWKGKLLVGHNEIQVSTYPRGSYLLQMQTGTQKVILQ